MTIENFTHASTNPVSLVPCKTGPGRTAWRAIEGDAPGLFAHIYSSQSLVIPLAPETDSLTIAIVEAGTEKVLGTHVIEGRAGLNCWYHRHVGFEPDKEPGGPRSILELIDNVAAHLLLRYFAGECVIETSSDPTPMG